MFQARSSPLYQINCTFTICGDFISIVNGSTRHNFGLELSLFDIAILFRAVIWPSWQIEHRDQYDRHIDYIMLSSANRVPGSATGPGK